MINFREYEALVEPFHKEIAHQKVVIDRLSRKIEKKIKDERWIQKRIDKALEFINANKWNGNYEDDYDIFLCEEDINQLEKILKGEII